MMDQKFKDLVSKYRLKIVQTVDTEKLFPDLARFLSPEEVGEIEGQTSRMAKVEKLLELLSPKTGSVHEHFWHALQTSYPQFSVQYTGSPSMMISDSRSTSMTSDSEDDVQRHHMQLDACRFDPRLKIIPSSQYDLSSTSSSYPTLPGHHSPHDLHHSPLDGSKSSDKSRDYDWLKGQCEHAINELQSMKHQHAQLVTRYDQATKEADHYRNLYKTSLTHQEQLTDEIHSLKSMNIEMTNKGKKLELEVGTLHKLREEDKQEIAELGSQYHKVVSEGGAGDAPSELYDSLLAKYQSKKSDFDMLREQYGELVSSHSLLESQLTALMEKNAHIMKELEDTRRERDTLISERNGLKQQCTSAIRNWNQVLNERKQLSESFAFVTQQRDKYVIDYNQALAKQISLRKDKENLQNERDACYSEYQLVMSERAVVHKEIEQLQDKLSEMSKKVTLLEKDKKSAEDQAETLKREVASALQDRDKCRRECNDMSGMKIELEQERDVIQKEFSILTQERDIARQERVQALERMDHILKENYEITQKKKAEEMDHVTKETESLKKHIEKLKQDLSDAAQEAEIAKKRRDWAFGERDKIVQERESIRSLCDNLRRERDRAVSDLAQALRDSDELKKQKNEAFKELKDIKEKYESVVEREARKGQLNSIGHNHSRDSAIDADLQEWESETIDVELELGSGDSYGFDLTGGKDDPQFQNDPSIFVSSVTKGGAAEGKLKVNDLLLKVNGKDVSNVEKRLALQAMSEHSGTITLVVKRRKSTSARIWQPLQLLLSCHKDPGIRIEHGLFITHIYPGGLIAKDGMLPSIGDRIVHVNNKPVAGGMNAMAAMKVLENSTEPVSLHVLRQVSPIHSAGSSPTPTSQTMSPLSDHSYHSNQRSHSDTIPHQAFSLDDSMSYTPAGNKTSRSLCSQTDSIDSSVPSSRKHRDRQHGIKGVIKDLFRPRPSHESQQDIDERGGNSYMSHSNLGMQENIIAEFDPVSNRKDERNKTKQRKREVEIESNSGTWPKTSHQMRPSLNNPSNTVIIRPQPKERPAIRPDSFNEPQFYERKFESLSRHHSQNSDPSIKYGHDEHRSLFVPPRRSPVFQPPVHNGQHTNYTGHFEREKGYTYSPPHHSHPPPQKDFPPPHDFNLKISAPHLNKNPNHHGRTSQSRNPDKRRVGPVNTNRPISLDVSIGEFQHVHDSLFDRIPSPRSNGTPLGNPHHPSQQNTYRSGPQLSAYTPPPYPPGPGHNPHPAHSHPISYRYSVPSNFHHDPPAFTDTFSRSPSQQSNSPTPTPSEDLPPPPHYNFGRTPRDDIPAIFRKKLHQGSVEIVSGPSSPGSSQLKIDLDRSNLGLHEKKPRPLETRTINIQKTAEPFGIHIQRGPSGGIFVSSVTDKSLAAQAGLVPGDQLLEVCGINMRTASHEHALMVLRQCGDTLTMKVQYNPDKFREPHESSSTGSVPSVAGTITSSIEEEKSPLPLSHLSPSHGKNNSTDSMCERPRIVSLKKRNSNIGFSILGGNATGIFVHEPLKANTSDTNNLLQRGDQIIEYNGQDFRGVTAEQAVCMLRRPCSIMCIKAQLNLPKYNKIQNVPGDSLYIRANFDRLTETENELAFRKDDIMLVENTLYGGEIGLWYACLVTDDGKKLKRGIIPSRMRLEDDMVLRRSLSESVSLHEADDLKGSRRGSGTYRRSFFRRKRHQRNNSKESRELGSFSDASLNSDSVPLLDDSFYGYTIMQRIESGKKVRPVVLLAPLSESLIRKLESESPDKYRQCKPSDGYTQNQLNQNVTKGVVIDYWRRDDHFECIRVKAVEEICDKKAHCLLNVSAAAIERLHHHQIYPIVIFVRHKSWKQIREIRDVQFLPEKLSNKAAKDLYEQHMKIEADYHHLFSATIQGGNLAEMSMHIKTVIAAEQKKPVWVAATTM